MPSKNGGTKIVTGRFGRAYEQILEQLDGWNLCPWQARYGGNRLKYFLTAIHVHVPAGTRVQTGAGPL